MRSDLVRCSWFVVRGSLFVVLVSRRSVVLMKPLIQGGHTEAPDEMHAREIRERREKKFLIVRSVLIRLIRPIRVQKIPSIGESSI